MTQADHLWGIGGNRAWVWKSFTRGLNPIFMDPYDGLVLGGDLPAASAIEGWVPGTVAVDDEPEGQSRKEIAMVDFWPADVITDKSDLVSELGVGLRKEDFGVGRKRYDASVCAFPGEVMTGEEKSIEAVAGRAKYADRAAIEKIGREGILQIQNVWRSGVEIAKGREVDQDIKCFLDRALA